MPIPLKIHEIRLRGADGSDWDELYQDSTAMDRFYLVLGELKQIIREAEGDPNSLHLITMPEGCISSHYFDHTYATHSEYLFMKKTLEALISKTTNVLLIPGTIVYPVGILDQVAFKNIALILYQDKCYEYQQRITPISRRLSAPMSFFPWGRIVERDFKPLIAAEFYISSFILEFQSQRFTLYPQICIEHFSDTLQYEPYISPYSSLQVIVSGSVIHKKEACRAGLTVHTDTVVRDSSVTQNAIISIFDLKSVKRHSVAYDWINHFADVSVFAPLTSLFCSHWGRVRDIKISKNAQDAPSSDLSKALIGLK